MNSWIRRLLRQSLRRVRLRLTAYRNPISIVTGAIGGRQVRVDDLRRAVAPALVERGRNDSVLVIVFTGGVQELMMPVYEFFETTELLGYSRILLCDQYRQLYYRGIDKQRPDFPSLIAYLREEIERLSPKRVLCIGTSAGGYAAIRAGHELRADYVHAFGALTGSPLPNRKIDDRSRRVRRLRIPPSFLDLAEVLKEWNQKTIYYIHYCGGCDNDRYQAERMFRAPGVVTIGYPCDSHQVAVFLTKKGFLTKALAVRDQHRLVELAKEHFPDGLEIKARPEAATGCAE